MTGSLCSAMIADDAAYQSSETVKIVRRPNRSATKPNRMVPMNRPANSAATKLATLFNASSPVRKSATLVTGGAEVFRILSRTSPGAT